jgi:hypothetical protein
MSDKPITAKKAFESGFVSVQIDLNVRHFGDTAKIKAGTYISTASARELAADLIRLADEADAKIANKKAAEERRQKWREREIAAGRLKVISWGDVRKGNIDG